MAYGQRGGFGGGMNLQAMQRQALKLQEQMQKAQEEIRNTEVEGSAGGMVTVTMMADKTVTGVSINPEAVDPDDIEMLEDLLVAAFNAACEEADKVSASKMPAGVGGLF